MRRIAMSIMLIGFIFTFFSLPFMGIDLLIDAVGYLLVWNGARALNKKNKVYGLAPWYALALVAVTALQLFFTGTLLLVVDLLRFALEALLYWQIGSGFAKLAVQTNHKTEKVLGIALAVAGISAAVFGAAHRAFFPNDLEIVRSLLKWAAQTVMLLALVRFASVFGDD